MGPHYFQPAYNFTLVASRKDLQTHSLSIPSCLHGRASHFNVFLKKLSQKLFTRMETDLSIDPSLAR